MAIGKKVRFGQEVSARQVKDVGVKRRTITGVSMLTVRLCMRVQLMVIKQ
jgi:hypothetical protein